MQVLKFVKEHPYISGLAAAVAAFAVLRPSTGNGGPSDSVVTTSINANKEIAIARLNAQTENKATQADLIKARIQSDNSAKLGLAITNNSRVVDLSRIRGQTKTDLTESNNVKELGKYKALKEFQASKIRYGTERQIAAGAREVSLRGLEYAREATTAEINGRTKIAEIAAQVQRERNPWDAQIANRQIDAQIAGMQLETMLGFDNNATNVTLMKKQTAAQNLATGLNFAGGVIDSGNQTAASLGNSFFGMIGNIFGGFSSALTAG